MSSIFLIIIGRAWRAVISENSQQLQHRTYNTHISTNFTACSFKTFINFVQPTFCDDVSMNVVMVFPF